MPTKNPEPLAAQLEELLPDWICAHNAAATLRSQYAEIEALKKAALDALSVCDSVSMARDRRIVRDGCVMFMQTQEWCEWAEREVGPALRAILAGKDGT